MAFVYEHTFDTMGSMTRPIEEVRRALELHAEGVPTAEVARRTAIPRSTIRYWLDRSLPYERRVSGSCQPCPFIERMPTGPDAYLLGLYLGDGCLSESVAACSAFASRWTRDTPASSTSAVGLWPFRSRTKWAGCSARDASRFTRTPSTGSVSFRSTASAPSICGPSCLHSGSSRSPLTAIRTCFFEDSCSSDGWRGTNRVPGGYEYPRYMFSNRSADIRQLFQAGCQRMAINCRPTGKWQVAVSRRKDVARMDVFIGTKR